MGFWGYKPYVSVAARGAQAEKLVTKLRKQNAGIQPVRIEGRTISRSVWGKAWCSNLESYRDYENRLPRGRSCVRSGSVIDLKVAKGSITAKVLGSELYDIKITIAPVTAPHWTAICKSCAGGIGSLVELLQGRLDKSVMDRFPAPAEIKLSCSCPDWADMCKHVAAAMYGVGARLDTAPELLFVLRGVDAQDMIAEASTNLGRKKPAAAKDKLLVEDDMAALFGLDLADTEPEPPIAVKPAKAKTKTKAKNVVAPRKTAKAGQSTKTKVSPSRSKKRQKDMPSDPIQKPQKRLRVAA
jgi:uncharacterized Zn finger protein